jgi:thioredoxin 1
MIEFKRFLQKFRSTVQPSAVHNRPLDLPATPTVVTVTDTTFADVVLATDLLVVVDFWADWCQPCQIMSAYVGFLAKDFGDQIVLAALDVDENPETPARYDIMGLPTLLLLRQGQEIDRIVGVEPYEAIRDRVASQLVEQREDGGVVDKYIDR